MIKRLIFTVLAVAVCSHLGAATFYVTTSGNDTSGTGSQSAPWRTVQKAANSVSAGDTVLVGSGTYTEFVTISRSGTSSSPITFAGPASLIGFCLSGNWLVVSNFVCDRNIGASPSGAPPAKFPLVEILGDRNLVTDCTMDARYQYINCLKFGRNDNYSVANYNTVRKCNLLNSGQQFILYVSRGNTVEQCSISGFSGDVMHILGWDNVFRSNEVFNITYSEALHTDIFQTIGGSSTTWSNNVFEANYVHDCDAQIGNLEESPGGTTKGTINNFIFRNNVFARVTRPIFAGILATKFYNNVFYKCYSGGAILFYDGTMHDCDGSEAYGNVFLDSGTMGGPLSLVAYGNNYGASSTYGTISGTLGPNSINGGDPLFVNPAGDNFRLQAGSILRDRGITIPGFYNDADGNLRPSGAAWDIGAYEFTSGAATNPVIAVTPMSVDFGLVQVGSSADRTVVVKNVGAGTLAGAVTAAAPISVVSGGSYSLGSNQSQTVTLRYRPTQAGNASPSILFSGGGGATVTGRGAAWAVLSGTAFDALAGTITAPFVPDASGYITQSTMTTSVADSGRAVYGFQLASAGNYVITANVNAPDAAANSLFVNIDGDPVDPTMIWDIPMTAGFADRIVSWRGTGTDTNAQFAPKGFDLAAGTHYLVVRGREPGVQVARLTVSPNSGTRPEPPVVSAVTQSVADANPALADLQVVAGTGVQYTGNASDPAGGTISWQWVYAVNSGAEVVHSSGSGTVAPAVFTYPSGTAGSSYVWKLRASNAGGSVDSAPLTVQVVAPPPAVAGAIMEAETGTLSGGFVTGSGYIYQATEALTPSAGGRAAYAVTVPTAGLYTIQARVSASDMAGNSLFINIDAEPADPNMVWDIPVASGFVDRMVTWRGIASPDAAIPPQAFNLTAGTHNIIVRGREANVQIDNLRLVPATVPPPGVRVTATNP